MHMKQLAGWRSLPFSDDGIETDSFATANLIFDANWQGEKKRNVTTTTTQPHQTTTTTTRPMVAVASTLLPWFVAEEMGMVNALLMPQQMN